MGHVRADKIALVAYLKRDNDQDLTVFPGHVEELIVKSLMVRKADRDPFSLSCPTLSVE